ncbi:MAG: hypothetical protein ACTSPV_15270 [Candidatus Hodarchaeales archaeon]
MGYQAEISYLLSIPADEIIRVVLEEAIKDLKITPEEQNLIDGIKSDLSGFKTELTPVGTNKLTKVGLQLLLIKQRNFLKNLVYKTYERAKSDNNFTEDGKMIYKVLVNKVDEIIATKIGMFLSLNLDEPHFLMVHRLIGEKFTNLCATIMMDVYSAKINQTDDVVNYLDIKRMADEFSSEDTKREFILKFKEVLRSLSEKDIKTPNQLINAIDDLISRVK